MDFLEVLDLVVDLLRSRGRVTYGVLKLQFQLDDTQMEVLKDELIYGQRLAIDEDGRVLVWTGETSSTSPSPSTPVGQSDIIQEDRLTQTTSLPAQPPTPDAERRQLTVMFCDLVGSTELSGQLDPETLREVVRAYQEIAAEVIQHYEGYIAQYLGDGLLIYFGYPSAHEDDAVRAVHTGLGILDRITTVNTQLPCDYGVQLAVRIGVHSGLVVVGEMGGGGRHEQLALGETPNIASRLEGLAAPNQMVISAGTQRLVGGAFDLNDLGVHALRGVSEPMRVYGVHGESAVESRFEAATVTGLTPLVGRDEEISLVLRRWEQAKDGEGQVVLLAGEAGIGKSRMTQTLRERLAEEPHLHLRCQCFPYYTNSAFYPIVAHLERAMRCERDAPPTVLEVVESLIARLQDVRVLLVLTFRPEFVPPWGGYTHVTSYTLNRLSRQLVAMLVDQLTEGKALPAEVLDQVVAKTDGVPLFVAE